MGFLSNLLGSKPEVPQLQSLDLGIEQQKALADNLGAIPKAEQVAGKVDLFNQQQIDQMLGNVIPNYKAMTQQIGANISQMVGGQVPTDVSESIQRSAAAKAIGGGYAGTEAQRNLTARDLGLTSLELTQQGLASAEGWMKTASSIYEPGMFNVASMFVNPAQQATFDVSERQSQFQTEWMRNQIEAMPDPETTGLYNLVSGVLGAGLLPSISSTGVVPSSTGSQVGGAAVGAAVKSGGL